MKFENKQTVKIIYKQQYRRQNENQMSVPANYEAGSNWNEHQINFN